MYKLFKDWQGNICSFLRLSDNTSIPFDHQNSDFQAFRTSILDGLAQLENADGVLLSKEEAIAFVETLGEA